MDENEVQDAIEGETEKKRETLWRTYKENPARAIRDELVVEYAYLVKYVAGRLSIHMGQYVDYDDLVGYGIFGLFDAIEKFDIDREIKFETYASLRIRGSIIDSIRRLDWVPRTLRQKSKQLEEAEKSLEATLQRPPTIDELAKELMMSVKEIEELKKETNISAITSLDELLDFNHEKNVSSISQQPKTPEEIAEEGVVKNELAAAIDKLNDNEKKVITLYYFEELTLKEISKIIGVTESRISQIHTKSIQKLKGNLGKHQHILFQ